MFQASLDRNALMREFGRFGSIEQLEIKRTQQHIDQQEQTEYAYVTYLDSLAAHTAVAKLSNADECKFKIQPADTWHQPTREEDHVPDVTITDGKNTICKLNDDCLANIFKYCDIESLSNAYDVCQHFRQLAEQQKHRRKWRNITFKIMPNSSLRTLRQILRYTGTEIQQFRLQFHYNNKPKNLHRFLYKIVQYLKGEIKHLTIEYLVLENDVLQLFRPLLSNIETLKFRWDNYDFEFDIDLRSICTNLTDLSVRQNLIFVLNSGPWERLQKLSVHDNQYMEGPTFDTFCKNNRQLKRLSIQSDDSDQIFESIGKYLSNIEKLSIQNGYPSITAVSLNFLKDLKQLTNLKLTYVESFANDILKLVCNLKQLTYFKMQMVSDNEEEAVLTDDYITDIANNLPKLKVLHLGNFTINENLLLNLIQSTPNLNELGITWTDVIDVNIQAKLNAARSLTEASELLSIIKNPFEVDGPKHCKEIALMQFIKIGKYFAGDSSIKFDL